MDGWTTDAGVTGILIAHLGAFGSGELKMYNINIWKHQVIAAMGVKESNQMPRSRW